VAGTYSPYPGATVICATNEELLAAAAATVNGGFGAALRLAVTDVNGTLQVSYVNPAYMGTAYGLGRLEGVTEKLGMALGHVLEFGSEGVEENKLKPGKYHYKMMMPYFHDIDVLSTYADHASAVDTIEKNLAAKAGGTEKVYRIDIPEKDITVFGIAIPEGDGPTAGAKDTDREVMEIVDYQEYRSTPYLPYEILVQNNQAIALRARYRIAVNFPDTTMVGSHGFTAIMSAPDGIKNALRKVAGQP